MFVHKGVSLGCLRDQTKEWGAPLGNDPRNGLPIFNYFDPAGTRIDPNAAADWYQFVNEDAQRNRKAFYLLHEAVELINRFDRKPVAGN